MNEKNPASATTPDVKPKPQRVTVPGPLGSRLPGEIIAEKGDEIAVKLDANVVVFSKADAKPV